MKKTKQNKTKQNKKKKTLDILTIHVPNFNSKFRPKNLCTVLLEYGAEWIWTIGVFRMVGRSQNRALGPILVKIIKTR